MPTEDVAMCNPLLLDGILQGAGDVFLPDYVGELLGSIFAGENLITHERKIRLYGLMLWNGRSAECGQMRADLAHIKVPVDQHA
jgi:hypothetical protein